MASDGIAAAVRAALSTAMGAVAATAWTRGLYATAVLAGFVALWALALGVLAARPRTLAAAPVAPAAVGDEAERRRLTAYLDFSPAPLVALDDQARLHVVNRAARRLLGAEDLVPDAPPALLAALEATAPGRTATVELSDGERVRSFALATGDLSFGSGATRIGALIDIDAELKAAEASALRELVQVLSHEIVNALTPIASLAQTAAEMLGDRDPDLPQVREAVETVARRASGLHRFGESYRALARLPAPVKRRIAAGPYVADLERLFTTRWPAIPLAVDVAPSACLHGDPDQLTAAFWALLQNAAEALANHTQPGVGLTLSTVLDATTVTISDNGPGIPAGDAEHVFRAFYTTKADGTGVGLALARQILRGHGGDLVLEPSQAGETSFRALLPNGR